MTHASVDTGLVLSVYDTDRISLLLANPDEPGTHLECGIPVSLFKASGTVSAIPRISLRVLDSDMFRTQCHPIQYAEHDLFGYMNNRELSRRLACSNMNTNIYMYTYMYV